MDLFKAGQLENRNMTARRFPPPWSVEEQAACFVVRDQTVHRCGLRFVYLRRLFANIRRLAERSGLVSVLNSQTPRLSRRIFHPVCACLISAKKRQLNQRIVSLLHCRSRWQRSHSKAVGTREPTALPLRLAHRTGVAPTRTSQGASNRPKEKRPSLTGRRVRDPIRPSKHTLNALARKR
jgi:hypothetical protein